MSNESILDKIADETEHEETERTARALTEGKDEELDRMKAEAPLLDRIRRDTGETGREAGGRVDFHKCPVCGHSDDFSYYPDTNSWKCFSASDGRGGTYIDYLMAVDGLTESQAITELREATGHPRRARRSAEAVAVFPEIPFIRAASSGNIRPTPGNVKLAIEHDEVLRQRIRLNKMTGAIEFARPLPWSKNDEAGFENPEIALAQFTVYIERKYKVAAKKPSVEIAVTSYGADNAYDPVLDMFDRLPPWDGTRRVDRLLEEFLKAEPTPYTRAVSRLMVCGLVERQFQPGMKFDCMVVLEGHQGCGKSKFCEMLARDKDFCFENMQSMDSGNTEALIGSQGKTVIEIAELNALRRAKTSEAAKAFITATHDEYRGKYDKHATKHPRRFILIGTTNEREYLTDTTGNRRYFPVVCRAKEPTKYIGYEEGGTKEGRDYMTQVYAEALAMRREHGTLESQLILPRELQAEAARLQEGAQVESPYQSQVAEFVAGREKGDRVSTAMVAQQGLGIEPASGQYRSALREIGKLLDSMTGKVRRMEGKQRVRGYGTGTAWEVV